MLLLSVCLSFNADSIFCARYHAGCRDVYRIKSIVSYQYHKTDTGIVSKWQINDTFNDDINKDRASLTQKLMIFLIIKYIFCFSFLIIWKIMVREFYYTVCWVYQKEKKWIF